MSKISDDLGRCMRRGSCALCFKMAFLMLHLSIVDLNPQNWQQKSERRRNSTRGVVRKREDIHFVLLIIVLCVDNRPPTTDRCNCFTLSITVHNEPLYLHRMTVCVIFHSLDVPLLHRHTHLYRRTYKHTFILTSVLVFRFPPQGLYWDEMSVLMENVIETI